MSLRRGLSRVWSDLLGNEASAGDKPPPVGPTGLSLLAGISILRQGSVFLHPSELGQSIVNGMWPDSIVIGGSLSTTEVFESRVVNDAGTWFIQLLDSAALRRTNERALKTRLGVAALDAFGEFTRAELAAFAGLLTYVEITQVGRAPLLRPPRK